jgi:hypothetical protein
MTEENTRFRSYTPVIVGIFIKQKHTQSVLYPEHCIRAREKGYNLDSYSAKNLDAGSDQYEMKAGR